MGLIWISGVLGWGLGKLVIVNVGILMGLGSG